MVPCTVSQLYYFQMVPYSVNYFLAYLNNEEDKLGCLTLQAALLPSLTTPPPCRMSLSYPWSRLQASSVISTKHASPQTKALEKQRKRKLPSSLCAGFEKCLSEPTIPLGLVFLLSSIRHRPREEGRW